MLSNDKIVSALEEALPDELLAQVHREGLEAGKRIFKNNNESGEIEDMGIEPDYAVRHKYLDSAYKLKGRYAPEKSLNVNLDLDYVPEIAANFDEYLKRELKEGGKG